MHLVPIPGFAGVSETEALMALRTRSRSQSVGEDDSPEDILGESIVMLTAYAKWARQSDTKEADASAVDRRLRARRG
jgi:hypothetical protein